VAGETVVKVAVVCPYDLGVPGGVQDQTTRLVRWLHDLGHDAVLVGPGTTGPEGAVLLGPTTAVRVNRSSAPIRLTPATARRVREATAGADVVHVHEPLVPAIGLAAIRAGSGVKVATFHADPSTTVRRLYAAGRAVARLVLSRAAVVTAVSETAASAVRRFRPVRIVPNGIDAADYGIGAQMPGRVVFLGRDDPRKGLDVLLEAWPRVTAAVPSASLEVIGARRRTPPAGVTYRGELSEADKRAALAAAQVMVAPNTGGESFGVVVLEGMASRCAVVASGIAAFASLLAGTGELVAPGDRAGLASAVVRLLGDEERRSAMAAAARQRAMDFDGPVVAGAYLSAYHEAISLA
jgi:phosphatidylinositol alpha-mannosyltransferase